MSLGCRVNRVELDEMAADLAVYGLKMSSYETASVVVVNTCCVTAEAQAKSRKALRRMSRLPQHPLVIATGCAAVLFADELRTLSPRLEVEPLRSRVVPRILEEFGIPVSKTSSLSEATPLPKAASLSKAASRVEPHSTTVPCGITPLGRTRPGIKIQDGCDKRCTFCIVWQARGNSRSVAYEHIRKRVVQAQRCGAVEVVLTGINLGTYNDEGRGLVGLLDGLLTDTDIGRIRLGSIEPDDVGTPELRLMGQSEGRIAPFLHVPLQSGSDTILKKMGRTYSVDFYRNLCDEARDCIEDLALCTDYIVGFPGEGEKEFLEGLEFCREMAFANMHLFRYSVRPGTPAATMDSQVDPHTVALRAGMLRTQALRMRSCALTARIGHDELVVVQSPGRGVTGGLFDILVDESYEVSSLVRVPVRALTADGLLDARSM